MSVTTGRTVTDLAYLGELRSLPSFAAGLITLPSTFSLRPPKADRAKAS